QQQDRQCRAALVPLRKDAGRFQWKRAFPMRGPVGGRLAREAVIKQRQPFDTEVRQSICWLSEEYQAPAAHDSQTVKKKGVTHDMRGAKNSASCHGEMPKGFHEPKFRSRIQSGGRFIQKHQPWTAQQFGANADALTLSARELPHWRPRPLFKP